MHLKKDAKKDRGKDIYQSKYSKRRRTVQSRQFTA